MMRRLPTGVVLAVARLGPIGPHLPAPGTWGSLVGLLFVLVVVRIPAWAAIAVVAFTLYAAVCFCGEAEVRLGRRDPGDVVLDEFAVMPLCFAGWPYLSWWTLGVGFVLFRLFDIWKPLGIRRLQSFPGGWGVVADDVAAAVLACATLHLIYAAVAWLG